MSQEQSYRDECPGCGEEIVLVQSSFYKHRVVGYCVCTPSGAVVEKDKKNVPIKPAGLSGKEKKGNDKDE